MGYPMSARVPLLLVCALGCGGEAAVDDADAGPGVPPGADYAAVLEPAGTIAGGQLGALVEASPGFVAGCSDTDPARLYDVTDPAAPTVAASFAGPCHAIDAAGTTAVIADADGLGVYDMESGARLARRPGSFRGVAYTGDHVYATRGSDGVIALAWDGAGLTEAGTLALEGTSWGLAAGGDDLFVTDATGGVYRIDVADPTAMAVAAQASLPPSPQDLVADGERLWVAAGAGGVLAVDPDSLAVVAEFDTPGSVSQVMHAGDRVLAADWRQLFVFDRQLRPVAHRPFADGVRGVAVDGDHVFAAGWTGLEALRLHRDRSAPSLWIAENPVVFRGEEPAARSLILRNYGTEPLTIDNVVVEGQRLEVDRTELVVGIGDGAVVELSFSGAPDPVTGRLIFSSNDPADTARAVNVTAGAPELAVGEPLPEVLAALLGGGEWRSSQQLGSVVLLAYFATY